MEEPKTKPESTFPDHLYHYTSIEGLKGILDTRSLWASQIHFLNDTQEFKYSTTILEKVLSERKPKLHQNALLMSAISPPGPYLPKSPEEAFSRLYDFLSEMVTSDVYEKIPICVFSLSKWWNLLSQWRGYCPSGGGYSIGFRFDLLNQILQKKNFRLLECIYDQAEQKTIIESEIDELERDFRKCEPTKDFDGAMMKVGGKYFLDFSRKAPTFKDPSFGEEGEWRIVSNAINPKDLKFRVGRAFLIPFFPISLEDTGSFPIDEIWIGPAAEQALAENSLQNYLRSKKLSINLKISKIPYRQF